MKITNRISTKLNTFTHKDAKLRQLLLWYQHHKNKNKCDLLIPKHFHSRLRMRAIDVAKMKYTEKNELIDVLEATETSMRRFRKQEQDRSKNQLKQQPITNYIFVKG